LLRCTLIRRIITIWIDAIRFTVVFFATLALSWVVTTDAIARVLAQRMAKDLGASIIIENKPGAGAIIGAQAVATAEGDGYTLLMGTFAHAVNPSLSAKLPFDPHKDLRPSRWWHVLPISSSSIRNRRFAPSPI
jgi:Tripartite tricarboxylate transporter family receptor